MRAQSLRHLLAVAQLCGLFAASAAQATVIAAFDDLPTPPPVTGATGFQFANGNSLGYKGVTWDSNISVVGDQYRVDTGTPGPLFGLPHSGHYFITNGGTGGDGIMLTTSLVLTGAWFGPNVYYGFGRGADRITIVALSGATALGSVMKILYDTALPDPQQPDPLTFVDTSVFLSYSNKTGYRIDRNEPVPFAVNWVADDFQFEAPSVPLPGTFALAVIGLLALFGARRSRA